MDSLDVRQSSQESEGSEGASLGAVAPAKSLPATAADANIGRVLDDHFQIMALLGSGGMGCVYLAENLKMMNSKVAVKILQVENFQAHDLKRFRQEATLIASLSHPHIVSIYQLGGLEGGHPYQVMELLEGTPLDAVIEKEKCLSFERTAHILRQICDALQHAHGRGVVHRDVKPSNVILINSGEEPDQVKLIDFGIAKRFGDAGENQTKLTRTGKIIGSALYMSPEQILGESLDGRSDLYSLGCMMYEMLTGSPPFLGCTKIETLDKQINEAPPFITRTHPELGMTSEIERLLLKAMHKDSQCRFQSALEFKAELEEALRTWEDLGGSVSARKRGQKARVDKGPPSSRRRLRAILCLVLLIALPALAIVSMRQRLAVPVLMLKASLQERLGDKDPRLKMARLLTLGQSFSRLGAWEQAAQCYRQSLDLAKARYGVHSLAVVSGGIELAQIYNKTGDRERAAHLMTELLALSDDLERELAGKRDWPAVEKAAAMSAGIAEFLGRRIDIGLEYAQLGYALMRQGKYAGAELALLRADEEFADSGRKLVPARVMILSQLGSAQEAQGHLLEAETTLLKTVKLLDQTRTLSPVQKLGFTTQLAAVQYELSHFAPLNKSTQAMLRLLKQARAPEPTVVLVLCYRSAALSNAGKVVEARNLLARALKIIEAHPHADWSRARRICARIEKDLAPHR